MQLWKLSFHGMSIKLKQISKNMVWLGQAVLLVAHTVQDHNGMDQIRIISARQAEKKERKQYEQNRYLQNGFE